MADKKSKSREILHLINVMPKDTYNDKGNLDTAPTIENGILINEVRMEGTVKDTMEEIFFKVTVYSHSDLESPKDLSVDGNYLLKGITRYKAKEKVPSKRINADGTPFIWEVDKPTILAGTGIYRGKPE